MIFNSPYCNIIERCNGSITVNFDGQYGTVSTSMSINALPYIDEMLEAGREYLEIKESRKLHSAVEEAYQNLLVVAALYKE